MKKIIFLLVLSIAACKENEVPDVPEVLIPYRIDVPAWIDEPIIPAVDNLMTQQGVTLGKRLFYDTRLSGDNTMACATCHVQADGFSDKRKFSVGINGKVGDRQAMPIFNLGWNDAFFWDGRAASLEIQAHDPVVNPIEMNTTWATVLQKLQADKDYPRLFKTVFGSAQIEEQMVTKALAQFERSIVSFNSKYDRFYYLQDSTAFNATELRGAEVFFRKAGCGHCHTGILFSDNTFRNNGLDVVLKDLGQGAVSKKQEDNGKFKVNTLRNIAFTAPYMHDGRFETLEEVINHYFNTVKPNSPNLDFAMLNLAQGQLFSESDKLDLLAFLHTLSDSTLLQNPAYRR